MALNPAQIALAEAERLRKEREGQAARATQARQAEDILAPLPTATPELLGTAEEQAQRSILARQLMGQQQAAQRQLASQQARAGVRGGAAAAQQARLARQLEAERASQEEAGFLTRRQFNIQQMQKKQFADLAAELARRQLAAGVRAQDIGLQAAREYGVAAQQAQQQGGGGGIGLPLFPTVTGGKVICAELGNQGYLDIETLEADADFGRLMFMSEPEVMHGYWKLAKPVVFLMKKSKAFTFAVSLIAKPWARHMAYLMGVSKKDSIIGAIVHAIGKPICRAVGKRVVVYG